jgi:hypothetical protein
VWNWRRAATGRPATRAAHKSLEIAR